MNRNASPDFAYLVGEVMNASWYSTPAARDLPIQRQTSLLVLNHLLRLATRTDIDPGVSAVALDAVLELEAVLEEATPADPLRRGWFRLALLRIDQALDEPGAVEALPVVTPPPGSPIGSPMGSTMGSVGTP